jgi:hypothetical protein
MGVGTHWGCGGPTHLSWRRLSEQWSTVKSCVRLCVRTASHHGLLLLVEVEKVAIKDGFRRWISCGWTNQVVQCSVLALSSTRRYAVLTTQFTGGAAAAPTRPSGLSLVSS